MTESPPPIQLPKPVEVPAARMWTALVVPPIASVVGSWIAALTREEFILAVPLLVIPLIIGCSVSFFSAVSRRYRGPFLVFLMLAYLIGQVVICLVLWFGSCVLLNV